jgi:hypothetical protein
MLECVPRLYDDEIFLNIGTLRRPGSLYNIKHQQRGFPSEKDHFHDAPCPFPLFVDYWYIEAAVPVFYSYRLIGKLTAFLQLQATSFTQSFSL